MQYDPSMPLVIEEDGPFQVTVEEGAVRIRGRMPGDLSKKVITTANREGISIPAAISMMLTVGARIEAKQTPVDGETQHG